MKQQIKNGLVHGLAFMFIVWIIWVTYAAVTQVSSWQTLTADLFNQQMVPTWAVMAFNGATCPTGWNAADGSGDEKNTSWANTTLDLRDEFIRWASDTNPFGTVQLATHLWQYGGSSAWNYVKPFVWNNDPTQMWNVNTHYTSGPLSYNNGSAYLTYAFRPRNVALLFCIKD